MGQVTEQEQEQAQGQGEGSARRTDALFAEQIRVNHLRTDRLFAILMALQAVAALGMLLFSRGGPSASTVAGLGAVFCGVPILLAVTLPGTALTRYGVAVGQALCSALLIHLTGGRLETHFHIFGSLAFIALYRDPRVLLTYSGVVVLELLLLGHFLPGSLHGTSTASLGRGLEHAGWIAFADVFLLIASARGLRDLRALCAQQARLEGSNTQLLRPLRDSAGMLSEAAQQITASTSAQRQTLTRQAAALQQTQVTAREIQQNSLLAARTADTVLQVAERVDTVTRSGEAAVEKSLQGLEEIGERVEAIALRIIQLNESLTQIGSITETVKNLADQSNMLAVNAAIEAVRSGEHGKGFGVVAREIRSLADQSIVATHRVRQILDAISNAVRDAVDITEVGAEKVERGLVQMKASGKNLRVLSDMVKDSSSAVRQIAAAVGQQNEGVAQIFQAVTDLSATMDEAITRLDSAGGAADMLLKASAHVTEVVRTASAA